MSQRGSRYPMITAASLRAHNKKKNLDKEGSSSNPDRVDAGIEVNQSLLKRKPMVLKKRKSELENLQEESMGKGKTIPLAELSEFVERQRKLHSFMSGGDGTSVWHENYPFSVVADEVSHSAADFAVVREAGDLGVDQYLQVLGAWLLSVGRIQEIRHKGSLVEKQDFKNLQNQLLEKENEVNKLAESLKEKLEMVKLMKELEKKNEEAMGKMESENVKLKSQLDDVNSKLQVLEKNRETDLLDVFTDGFERAISQIKFLSPGIDVSKMDAAKIVYKDQLVDDDTAERDDENMQADEDKKGADV